MTLYQHLQPQLTPEQEDHYVRLARHLAVASQAPGWDPALFDVGYLAFDVEAGADLAPEQVAGHAGLVIFGPLGRGPLAGIAALPGEDWPAYQVRVLGAEIDSALEDWLLSSWWRKTDNTATGAALRLMYVLDYGVPGDWMEIIDGRAKSDYLDNGFLWDRIGLMPPNSGDR